MKRSTAELIAEKTFIDIATCLKPTQYGTVASIFTINDIENTFQLKTIATGNKNFKKDDAIVADCHAEVLARKAYLYTKDPSKEVGLFCSHLPCGMFAIKGHQSTSSNNNDRMVSTNYGLCCRGNEYSHLKYYPRTKPSKKQSTSHNSMSCSDKILKWSYMGFNCKELPITKLKYIIINHQIPTVIFDFYKLHFPYIELISTQVTTHLNPIIQSSSMAFWTDFKIQERLVNGYKQGGKKLNNAIPASIQSKLCKSQREHTKSHSDYDLQRQQYLEWRRQTYKKS